MRPEADTEPHVFGNEETFEVVGFDPVLVEPIFGGDPELADSILVNGGNPVVT